MSSIGLRASTADDSEYCFQLHQAAMGEYVDAIWGWDEQDQRRYHQQAFTPNQWQIITIDTADVGMLSVEHHRSEIYLARIEIQPSHQGNGIGTHIVRQLLDQAATTGRSVTLDVLAVNARARTLYQRLGFAETARHGTNNIKIRMTATPRPIHRS